MILNCFLCFSSFQNNSRVLWSPDKKLNWNQFNGIPNTSSTESAATKTRIEIGVISKKQIVEFNVQCFFESSKSWAKTKDSFILLHEQIHFDIAEVAARNLRKELSELKYTNEMDIKSIIKDVYHKNVKFLINYQTKYDSETNHSRNENKQKIWEERVSELLNNLKNYSNTKFIVKLN